MLISVIIPVYNAAKTIGRCIESVVLSVERVTKDYEIICVDDGSTDNSLEMLTTLAEGNPKLIVLHQQNAGAASARNRGLEVAQGDFIAFNDADDEWCEFHVALLLAAFTAYPEVCCVSANHDVERQVVCGLKKLCDCTYEVSLIAQQFKNWFSPPNSMISRKIIEFGVRFDPAMKGSEEVLFYNHILRDFRCLFVNKMISRSILGKFRFGDGGLSGNLREMEKGELYALRDAHRKLGVPFFVYACACAWSLLKYVRRIVIVRVRRMKANLSRA